MTYKSQSITLAPPDPRHLKKGCKDTFDVKNIDLPPAFGTLTLPARLFGGAGRGFVEGGAELATQGVSPAPALPAPRLPALVAHIWRVEA